PGETASPPTPSAEEGGRKRDAVRPQRPRVRRRKKRPEAGRGRGLWVLAAGGAPLVVAVLLLVLALRRRAGEPSGAPPPMRPLSSGADVGGNRPYRQHPSGSTVGEGGAAQGCPVCLGAVRSFGRCVRSRLTEVRSVRRWGGPEHAKMN